MVLLIKCKRKCGEDMSMHSGHRDRVKQKVLENGFQGMHHHEILEFLLFYSVPRSDTNPLAHALIEHFGGLEYVFEATVEELTEVKGIGEHTAILIHSIPLFAREYATASSKIKKIQSTTDATSFLIPKFIGRTEETFILVTLDNKSKITRDIIISRGTVNQISVHIRKIIEMSLKYKASRVIIAHNHPHGSATPSLTDIETTRKIKTALEQVGITLFDHIIVVGEEFLSMAEEQML